MDMRNNPVGALNQFLYTRCYDQLCTAVSAALGRPVSAVTHRNKFNVEVDEDSVYYVFRVWAEYSPDDGDDLRLTVKIIFDGVSYVLSVVDVFPMATKPYVYPPRYGIYTDQNLIPDLHEDKLREQEAERFLRRYCPEALETPMPVPIRSIMEQQMGLNVIANIQLLDDAYAQTIYGDEDALVMNDDGSDILITRYQRGYVLIDGQKALLRGVGAMNNTLAHEAYHWFAHRAYVDFHKLIGKQADNSYNGTSRYSSRDILEIQAKAIAPRILMPRDTLVAKYREHTEENIHDRIVSLASFFHVSYTAAAIRLSQLGLYHYSSPTETLNVTPADASDIYFSDAAFRELVDTEQIVYCNNHYVINDPKYIELVWEDVPKRGNTDGPYCLTEYALSNPDKAFIRFTIDYRRVIDMGDNILQARSDAHLKAQVEAIRRLCPKEAKIMKQHAKRFEELFAKKEKKSFSDIAKEMIVYRYGRMADFNPADKSREWNPKKEMPETYMKYFSPQSDRNGQEDAALEAEEIEQRYQDNLEPRIVDKKGRIIEEASSPIDCFCADTMQPRQYYEKIMKGTAGQPDNSTLMSLCVGLCLSPKAASVLFKSAGRTLSWERTDLAYHYILLHLRGRYIEDVNLFLDELGLPPIGARRNITEE